MDAAAHNGRGNTLGHVPRLASRPFLREGAEAVVVVSIQVSNIVITACRIRQLAWPLSSPGNDVVISRLGLDLRGFDSLSIEPVRSGYYFIVTGL